MVKLNVPLIDQPDYTSCVPTTYMMVRNYYEQISVLPGQGEIKEFIGNVRREAYFEDETLVKVPLFSLSLAKVASKQYKVIYYTTNTKRAVTPGVFEFFSNYGIDKEKAENIYFKLYDECVAYHNSVMLNESKDIDFLVDCINEGVPPIILVYANIFEKVYAQNDVHAIVVTGYDGDAFYVNNPDRNGRVKEKYSFDIIRKAWHSMSSFTDNDIIVIRKKLLE